MCLFQHVPVEFQPGKLPVAVEAGIIECHTRQSYTLNLRFAASLYSKTERSAQNNVPERTIAAGRVKTQANARLRTVPHCSPLRFAAIVPATPDESTCVVLTGSPKKSAAPMVAMAVISAAAPCPYAR